MQELIKNILSFKKTRKVKRRKFDLVKGPTEEQIQTTFFEWLQLAYPKVRALTFAIPNGGYRRLKEAIRLKKAGVTKGVPDCLCAIPNKGWHGLFIEFKSKYGKLSIEQGTMIKLLEKEGYLCRVLNDWEDAKFLMIDYLKGSKYV